MVKEKIKTAGKQDEMTSEEKELILYNDDVNTFEFVIETLIEVCRHHPEQAEQCALVAHFKGRCGVKQGDVHALKPLQSEMTNRGLTVSIE